MRTYLHATNDPVLERQRLGLLEDRSDRQTFRRIGALGSAGFSLDGARCLEVGAGAGSVARDLARAVGPDGRVVATDIDLRFLDGPAEPNLEVRRHDIVNEPLPGGDFDLVHCRALLFHLAEPERAVERMVAVLRPGGWLLVEDADYVACGAATPTHPLARTFDRTIAAFMADAVTHDLFDPYVGRRLAGLVAGAGLIECGGEGRAFVRAGASGPARLMARSVVTRRDELVARGIVSDADFDAVLAALADPAFSYVDPLSFAAWGRV